MLHNILLASAFQFLSAASLSQHQKSLLTFGLSFIFFVHSSIKTIAPSISSCASLCLILVSEAFCVGFSPKFLCHLISFYALHVSIFHFLSVFSLLLPVSCGHYTSGMYFCSFYHAQCNWHTINTSTLLYSNFGSSKPNNCVLSHRHAAWFCLSKCSCKTHVWKKKKTSALTA